MIQNGFDDDNHGNFDIYQLLNLMKNIPGSNVYCLNIKGMILWHNNHAVQDLKQKQNDLTGKTAFDFFVAKTAKLCLEHDLEAINAGHTVCKQSSFELINGEIHEYFIARTPWMIAPKQTGGIIINSINMKDTLCQQFKTCYANNQQYETLITELQNLYFNSKQPLKEILLLTKLIISKQSNNNVGALCLELENFAKTLLSDCDNILMSKEMLEVKQMPICRQINLNALMREIFNKSVKIAKAKGIRLLFRLEVSNQLSETIICDVLRVNKISCLIIETLLKSALNFKNIEIEIYSKVELFHKIDDQNIFISVMFIVENYLLKKIISNGKYQDNNFTLSLANALIKELGGDLEFIDDKLNASIVIRFPVKV